MATEREKRLARAAGLTLEEWRRRRDEAAATRLLAQPGEFRFFDPPEGAVPPPKRRIGTDDESE